MLHYYTRFLLCFKNLNKHQCVTVVKRVYIQSNIVIYSGMICLQESVFGPIFC